MLPPPDMPPALAAKKIDGYIVAEPFNALGEVKAGARMLRFTGDIWKNHPCCVISMKEDVNGAKPEWTQKVVDAIVHATIYASRAQEGSRSPPFTDGKGYLPMPFEVRRARHGRIRPGDIWS